VLHGIKRIYLHGYGPIQLPVIDLLLKKLAHLLMCWETYERHLGCQHSTIVIQKIIEILSFVFAR